MRAEKPEGPQEPGNGRQHRSVRDRPRRRGSSGAVGFGNVMRDVRSGGGRNQGSSGGARQGSSGGSGRAEASAGSTSSTSTSSAPATTMPGMPGFDPALAQATKLDPGMLAAQQMGAVPTDGQRMDRAAFGVLDADDAARMRDASPTLHTQAQAQSSAQPLIPTPVVRMTPAALLETVLDESTKLAIDQASKELQIELEPVHLGPLVVRLRRDGDGHLDIQFRTREGDAARVLEAGTQDLRDKLAQAGFATVAIHVAHDSSLLIRQ